MSGGIQQYLATATLPAGVATPVDIAINGAQNWTLVVRNTGATNAVTALTIAVSPLGTLFEAPAGFRAMRDDALVANVQQLAKAVRVTGRPIQTDPLNSYDRRIVHNAFKDDPEVMTWSPQDDSRVKRITLRKRQGSTPA